MPGIGLVQPHQGLAERALAAAGFTDQAECLSWRDLERYAVQRVHGAARRLEVLGQLVDPEQMRRHVVIVGANTVGADAGCRA